MSVTRYTDGGPDCWMQSPTGEFVRYEDYERLRHDIERALSNHAADLTASETPAQFSNLEILLDAYADVLTKHRGHVSRIAECRNAILELFERHASETKPRQPDGYCYRFASAWGGSVLSFYYPGEGKVYESVPYYLGTPPKAVETDELKSLRELVDEQDRAQEALHAENVRLRQALETPAEQTLARIYRALTDNPEGLTLTDLQNLTRPAQKATEPCPVHTQPGHPFADCTCPSVKTSGKCEHCGIPEPLADGANHFSGCPKWQGPRNPVPRPAAQLLRHRATVDDSCDCELCQGRRAALACPACGPTDEPCEHVPTGRDFL